MANCTPPMRTLGSSSSHNVKPGRRRGVGFHHSTTAAPALLLFLLVLTLCGQAHARAIDQPVGLERLRAILSPRQDPLSNGNGDSQSSSTTSKSTKTTSKTSSATKSTSTSESQSSKASATGSSSQPQLTEVPRVFDSNVGAANFSNPACPEFLQGLSDNDNFNNCLPMSLLVGSSQSFLEAWTNGLLPEVIDDTCNVVLPTCNNLMQSLALKLKSQDTCADDFASGNPLVEQAYYGFIAYKPMYQAGCLKVSSKDASSASSIGAKPTQGLASGNVDDAGPQYCYVATTASNSAPVNAYIYTLPLGTPLPAAAGAVNCTDCLRQTMNYFADAATNATSPLSSLYPSAAQQINAKCGKNWVKSTIAVDQSTKPSSAGSLQASASLALAMAAVVAFGL